MKSLEKVNKSLLGTMRIIINLIITRIFNVLCGFIIFRFITRESYSISKTYFEVFIFTIQFIPKETFKRAIQKYISFNVDQFNLNETPLFLETVNMCVYLNYIFSLFSIIITYIFLLYSPILMEYKFLMFLTFLSSNLELYVEPIVGYLNYKLEYNKKIKLLNFLFYSRSILNLLLAYFGFDLESIIYSRVISSLIYIVYSLFIGLEFIQLKNLFLPIFSIKETLKNSNLIGIFREFIIMNICALAHNQLLNIVLVFLKSDSIDELDKGDYHFVEYNFSILCRIMYEPLEENFYNLVISLRNKSNKDSKFKELYLLENIISYCLIFGFILINYFYSVGENIFIIVFGKKWITDHVIKLLRLYSFYMSFLLINGMTRAFTAAVFEDKEMKYNNILILIGALIKGVVCFMYYSIFGYINMECLLYSKIVCLFFDISTSFILLKYDITLIAKRILNKNDIFTMITIFIFGNLILNFIKNIIPEKNNYFYVSFGGVIGIINLFLIFILQKDKIIEIKNKIKEK